MVVISSTIGQSQLYVDMDLAPQGEPGYDYAANIIGAMNGANSAGSAVVAVFTIRASDKYGRMQSIQFSAIVLIIGAILCASSAGVAMFMVVRVIAGFGIGCLTTVRVAQTVAKSNNDFDRRSPCTKQK